MPCAFRLKRPLPFDDLYPGCQFDVPGAEIIDFGGKTWCRFHLPLEAKDAQGKPKADWDEQAIKTFNEAIFAFIDRARSQGRPADLTGVVFPGDIVFDRYRAGTSALPSVIFFRAHFSAKANFTGAQFGDEAGFHKTQFSGNARFDQTRFSGDAEFREAQFDGDAGFEKAQFNGDTFFLKAQFKGNVEFLEAQFKSSAVFSAAQFSGEAWFEEAQFSSDANFRKARFGDEAGFWKAQFTESIDFTRAQFSGGTNFSEAQFSGPAWFEEARFGGYTDFSGAPGAGEGGNGGGARGLGDQFHLVSFVGAKFCGPAWFSNRRFLAQTNFSKCVFAIAPEFHNCPLHQDTDFTDAKFPDRSGEAAPAYCTLKLAMEQVRARDGEAMFHALEMECRRKRQETPISVKVFSRLYEWAADYGRSFMRPFYRLLGFCGVFFLIYLAAFTSNPVPWDIPIPWDIAAGVGRFTVAQVVRPFSAFTLTEGVTVGSESVEVSFGLACLAAIQSILSLGLIALFILALRRRLRMG
ncbi:MAG: pentapeptide repeat-containing protein [Proteobacteria bacterium]|nr:pentapeptide repeat-containing protein [Pseudomonadota bacterium]